MTNPDPTAELVAALEQAHKIIGAAPEETWGYNYAGDPDVPGGMQSWSMQDEYLCQIEAALARYRASQSSPPSSAEDMRERAAKVAETHYDDPGWNGHFKQAGQAIASAIRALPLSDKDEVQWIA